MIKTTARAGDKHSPEVGAALCRTWTLAQKEGGGVALLVGEQQVQRGVCVRACACMPVCMCVHVNVRSGQEMWVWV